MTFTAPLTGKRIGRLPHCHEAVIDADGREIGLAMFLGHDRRDEMLANVRLWAAAPDLLAACEDALEKTVGSYEYCQHCDGSTNGGHSRACWAPQMLAAVTKARTA